MVGAQINSGFGNRIYQNSSAYRKAHSCETTLINLVEDWRLARDQRQVVSILRKYQVKIGGHVSSSRFVSPGCPQGSALGPLLWNGFQNDLSYCLTANLAIYADDHQIYRAGADQAAVTFQLKDSANLATTWSDSDLLAGNLKKYQVLNLGFIQNDSNICVNDVEIELKIISYF